VPITVPELGDPIIYEANKPGKGRTITHGELFREVCSIANVLTFFGVKKGDPVALYLPMTW